jgi:Zn-dependent peptidase ImmA (M78 family)
MRLAELKRFAAALVPDVYITRSKLPGKTMGLASGTLILYAYGLTERERDLTILHELAHVLFDVRDPSVRGPRFVNEQWREDRADRWAGEILELLQLPSS